MENLRQPSVFSIETLLCKDDKQERGPGLPPSQWNYTPCPDTKHKSLRPRRGGHTFASAGRNVCGY
ncbi:hypothetical protein J6590_048183 [Homalodisca vitripennis]|nr:hypothetical protein J6590_048183 [Homalodisca vitripennis]